MNNRIIKQAVLLGLTACTAVIVLFACSKSAGGYGGGGNNNGGSGGTNNSVSIASMAFSSSSLTVASGTAVKWTNNDAITHTVTADDGSFDSGNIAPGGTYSHAFSGAGTYAYHCSIHTGMKGKVVVSN